MAGIAERDDEHADLDPEGGHARRIAMSTQLFSAIADLQRWVVPKLKRLLTTDHAHEPVLPSAE